MFGSVLHLFVRPAARGCLHGQNLKCTIIIHTFSLKFAYPWLTGPLGPIRYSVLSVISRTWAKPAFFISAIAVQRLQYGY